MKARIPIRILVLPICLAASFAVSQSAMAQESAALVRVACIGDSITYGHGIKDRAMTYPAQLQALLGDGYEVRNFGNSGRSILKKSMRGKEKRGFIFMQEHRDALAYEPHLVICNLGINDLMDFDKYGDEFVADYTELLAAYRELDSKPRLIVWTPLAPLFRGHKFHGDPDIDRINEAIGKVVSEMKIESIDLAEPLRGRADMFPDKIHPNAAGAAVIAEEVALFLRRRSISASSDDPISTTSTAAEITFEASEAPHLQDWADETRRLVIEWHPRVAELLSSDGFTPARQVKLRFKKADKGVAHASGSTISFISSWIEKNPDDFGVAVHELVHVIQAYPNGKPTWITEGIADYIRWAVYEKKPQAWFPQPLDGRKEGYLKSYRVAAGFFLWLESGSAAGIVKSLNAAMRESRYDEEFFARETGKTLQQLWKSYFESEP